MRRLVWICAFLFFVSDVFGQQIESGSLACLKGENQLNLVLDFSQSRIDGLSESDFIWKMSMSDSRGEGWEYYWKNECYRDFFGKFCIQAFEETQKIDLRFGSFPDAKYTAVLKLQTVDDDGELDGEIIIQETETGKDMAVVKKVHGEGGRWGSIENLIGDAMERAGESVGKFIVKSVPRALQSSEIVVSQTENKGKQLPVKFPTTLSSAYNAFRDGSIYNLSKKEKALVEQSFITEIENDLNNSTTQEDLEIIHTKIKYLDQYSAIRNDLKGVVEMLKTTLDERLRVVNGGE